MKIVNYEYIDSDKIPPLVTGVGMYSDTRGPISGYFIGIITKDNEDYLVAKTKLAFEKEEVYKNKIVVRKVFPDIQNNSLCIDNEADENCRRLEIQYNNGEISSEPIIEVPNEGYEKLTSTDNIAVISLKHDDYEKRKMLIETGQIYPKQREIKYY